MFSGGTTNPYDDIVAKTTDENLTTENWELILNLCDKVVDEGQEGSHNVIAAILKRLAHRNPNVQLYTLSLAESLSKNCGVELHREIASRAFTQGLEKLITDRTTHEKVKRRALTLIATWTEEFENDSSLGVMEDCYNNLKSKNYSFDVPQEAPPPQVDDEIRRKEEEELQRVLEMSRNDKGGRSQWSGYSAFDGSGAGASGSSSSLVRNATASGSGSTVRLPEPDASGYVRARTPSPAQQPPPQQPAPAPAPVPAPAPTQPAPTAATTATAAPTSSISATSIVTRVRALHTFEATEAGELAFQQGDIIKVVDRGYKDWWRGQLKGRTGIFPVNYVEPLPEPTAAEMAREVEQEAAVFSQAANVERLLIMLRELDPNKDNLADNEEIQELYRSCMALRPKIVKLIDKYSQKRADLVSMNETFVRARTIFDRVMEESLARHSGYYAEQQTGYHPYGPSGQPQQPQQLQQSGQEYSWGAPGAPYSTTTPAPYAAASATPAPFGPAPQPTAYANAAPTPAPGTYGTTPYPAQPVQPQQPQQPQQQPMTPGGQWGGPQPQQPQPYSPQQGQPGPQPGPQAQNQPASYVAYGPQGPQPYPQVQDPHPHAQEPYPQGQEPQPQPQVAQAQPQPQPSSPQAQPQPQPQQQPGGPKYITNGPPYVFDPEAVYPDQNAQAWAQYYAHGGKDLTGAVYFISVPGITDETGKPLADGQ